MRLFDMRLHVALLVLLTRPRCPSAGSCRTMFSFRYADSIGHVSYRNIFGNITSVVACSERCSEDPACRSVVFVPSSAICTTYAVRVPVTSTSGSVLVRYGELDKGTCEPALMFEGCSADSQCSAFQHSICYENVCRCEHGYSYKARTDTCHANCTEYGSTFTIVPYYLERSNDVGDSTSSTFQECADLCLAQQDFICRFIEFIPNACLLSRETFLTKPDKVALTDDGYTNAHRNCA